MKRFLALMFVCLAMSFTFIACAKKSPTEPGGPQTLPDNPQPTPTPVPVQPGKSTVTVKTMFGNQPLSNVTAKILFVGQSESSGVTDSNGQTTFVLDTEGNFTATIPAQGDILQSQLGGYCGRGQSTTVVFQAGGTISVTPTAIQYSYSGGNFPLVLGYSKGANSLNVKIKPAVLNLPAAWTQTFLQAQMVEGLGNTVVVSIPQGSTDTPSNLIVQGSAQTGAIKINSAPFTITNNWAPYADIRVTVKNGTAVMAGINFTVTDSMGQVYNATTQSDGRQTVRIAHTGNYSITIPQQGLLAANANNSSGTVAQAEVKDVLVQVGSADLNVTVLHEGSAWANLPLQVTDANGKAYTGSTNGQGFQTFHLTSVGNYTVTIPAHAGESINTSSKTGSIGQNQTSSANFNGRNGTLTLTNANYDYVYVGGTNHIGVKYVNAGDINYTVTVNGTGFPSPDTGISISGAQNITNNNTATFTETVGAARSWTSDSLSFHGAKAGNHPISINSPAFYLHKNWSLSVSLQGRDDPYKLIMEPVVPGSLDYKGWFKYTVSGTNVPLNTPVTLSWSYNMPLKSVVYQNSVTSDALTLAGYTGVQGTCWIYGYKRTYSGYQTDGSLGVTANIGATNAGSTMSIWY